MEGKTDRMRKGNAECCTCKKMKKNTEEKNKLYEDDAFKYVLHTENTNEERYSEKYEERNESGKTSWREKLKVLERHAEIKERINEGKKKQRKKMKIIKKVKKKRKIMEKESKLNGQKMTLK